MAAAPPHMEDPTHERSCCLCLGLFTATRSTVHPEESLSPEFRRFQAQALDNIITVRRQPRPNNRENVNQSSKVTFGGEEPGGEEPGQLKDPTGLAVSKEGEIFVVDGENCRLQVFTRQGTFVRLFPTVVSGEEMYPYDVAMDRDENVWVVGHTDSTAEFAVQYNKQGKMMGKFDLQTTRRYRGIAVDTRQNHILITETTGDQDDPHGEVLVFRPDGTLLRTVGGQQSMKYPWYVTVNGEGHVLVTDFDGGHVYMYNEKGQHLDKFGDESVCPFGICTDSSGNIILAEMRNRKVELMDKEGYFLRNAATGIEWPQAVAVTTQGQLVVTDFKNHKVIVYNNY